LPRSFGKKMLQGGFGDFYFYEFTWAEKAEGLFGSGNSKL